MKLFVRFALRWVWTIPPKLLLKPLDLNHMNTHDSFLFVQGALFAPQPRGRFLDARLSTT
jgi:hypothetical protein